MDKETEALQQLFKRYADGECTPEEVVWVENWYNEALKGRNEILEDWDYQTLCEEAFKEILTKKNKRIIRKYSLVAAASVLIIGIGLYFAIAGRLGRQSTDSLIVQAQKIDVAPGGSRATLILADGNPINLDSTKSGIRISEAKIVYNDGSAIETSKNHNSATTTNTLTTPKGGQYQIVLEDGTKVWLNAESTLTYPSSFAREERVVNVSGEAYFSVAKESGRPFKVVTKGQEIQVLGTEFNIKSYEFDRESKTTLVNGSVQVNYTGNGHTRASVMLFPSQQAVLRNAVLIKRDADVENEIAWKNGFFIFNKTSLEDMMLQVSRWYDINVHYVREASRSHYFYGKLLRSYKLSQVLKVLKVGGVDFNIMQGKDGSYELSVSPD